MELEPKEWNLTNSQDVLSDNNKFEESKKHKYPEENETVAIKKQKSGRQCCSAYYPATL
ncbi:hypothetical protein DAPPUDRAFT_313222 [Daphnia pulex]|uniref:Uncharacterized protein n=1 Tax=Daphnia pulex TaxID=6669 RepID=E9G231_DAPPU|nr:hypothetical protein DAPPUDRAFT_313222 [Daphnia pulex]|eukprot:EFX86376.1 hypothetical protein DAPPUDRAFT_313222 [Daphnia pulex]